MYFKLEEHIDHQRWLMNNGLLNDLHKNTLYMYGSLVHQEIKAVELRVDVEKKVLVYDLYASRSLLRTLERYARLKTATGLWDLWSLKRLLKRNGNLNFASILRGFVQTYCGSKWDVDVNIVDFDKYEEGFEDRKIPGPSGPTNTQSN